MTFLNGIIINAGCCSCVISCDPPDPEMNRHHYAIYVHNCRLVLLLRRDFTQVDAFRPAEFHWKLEQVSCVVCVCVCLFQTPAVLCSRCWVYNYSYSEDRCSPF